MQSDFVALKEQPTGTIEINWESYGWQDMYILVGNSIRVEKNIPKLTLWFCFFTGKNCFLFSPIDGWWYPNLNVGKSPTGNKWNDGMNIEK